MSDVWSFGILFWEIVTFGDTPYKNELSPKVFMELIKVRSLSYSKCLYGTEQENGFITLKT
jgi:hypothetical protein